MGILSALLKGVIKESSNHISVRKSIVDSYVAQGCTIINDPATSIRKMNNKEQLEDTLSTIAESVSKKHELFPYYETAVKMDGKGATLYSKAILPEAAERYPKGIKAKFEIPNPKGLSFEELQRQSYFSQTPIPMRMSSGTMMLGEMEDPYQDEIKIWKRCKFEMIPPQLPKPFRVRIMVQGTFDYYETLLQFQTVDLDGSDIILSNVNYDSEILFTIRYSRESGNTTLVYQSLAGDWFQIYKFLSFMLAANTGAHIVIQNLEYQNKLFELTLPKPLYAEGYNMLHIDMELVKDVIEIEKRYKIKLNPQKEFTEDDLQIISILSKSIQGEKTEFRWTEFSCNAVFKPIAKEIDFTKTTNFTMTSKVDIMIQDQKISNITAHTEFMNAKFFDAEHMQCVMKEIENDNPINIKMIPEGDENIGTIIFDA